MQQNSKITFILADINLQNWSFGQCGRNSIVLFNISSEQNKELSGQKTDIFFKFTLKNKRY